MKRREYLKKKKKKKKKNFIQQLGTIKSHLHQRSTILEIIPWTQNSYTLLYQPGHKGAPLALKSERKLTKKTHPCVEADREECTVCVQGIISEMVLRWPRYFCCCFLHKKYSRRFMKFRLTHWWQMEYSGDAFHTFLGLDSVIYLAVNGTVTSLPVFIQNILNCVLKTNKAFTGLEWHGINDKKFHFGVE